MIEMHPERRAAYRRNCMIFSVLSAIAAFGYLRWLLIDARPENKVLFVLLVVAELFNVLQAAGFWWTVSNQRWTEPAPVRFRRSRETVDIFITVCGEPLDVVAKTLEGAMCIRHPRKKVWILDDGKSPDVEALAQLHGAGYLTRSDRRGAKAGNINEALKRTDGHYVVIFDADHVPVPSFLERTMGVFRDEQVAFVQTPQSYSNRDSNRVAAGSNEQQGLFYGPIMRGRNSASAAFACGTNLIFRRRALESIGGMPEDSITEDLRVSLLLLEAGFTSEYIPVVLAHGMGPVDLGSYVSQQMRWARGGLEILFRHKPFFKGMRWSTRIQYALSFMYWFTGLAFSIYILLPILFLFFGLRPVQAPNQYPIYFVPYIVITLWTIVYASDYKITFRALWFTLASFPIFVAALASSVFGQAARFVVTSKGASEKSLRPVIAQLVAVIALGLAIVYGVAVHGPTPAVMNNVAFALGDIIVVQGMIRYAVRPESSADDIRKGIDAAGERALAEHAGIPASPALASGEDD